MYPLALVGALLVSPTSVPIASVCSFLEEDCRATNLGDHVDVSVGRANDGHSGRPLPERTSEPESETCDNPLGRCGEYEVVMRPDATLSDVASFAPPAAPLFSEPDGIGIVGLPLNIVAAGGAHVEEGELFDLPVTVRFRPAGYTFDYGDGTTRESPTGGRSWSALGLAQFAPTGTSHIYTRRGTFTVRAAVSYAAEVDFGTGWIAVPGLLVIPSGSSTVEILEARTALVDRDCLEDPTGVGC